MSRADIWQWYRTVSLACWSCSTSAWIDYAKWSSLSGTQIGWLTATMWRRRLDIWRGYLRQLLSSGFHMRETLSPSTLLPRASRWPTSPTTWRVQLATMCRSAPLKNLSAAPVILLVKTNKAEINGILTRACGRKYIHFSIHMLNNIFNLCVGCTSRIYPCKKSLVWPLHEFIW